MARRDQGEDRQQPIAGTVEEQLRELSVQIDRLRVLYEQHFLGMEKLPPTIPRREVERRVTFLGTASISNTAQRFRYLNLVRRWKLHNERWDKVLREIENGTYKPHLVAKERRDKQRGLGHPARPPRPPADDSAIPGMTEAQLRELHRRYLEARRQAGEAREVGFETLVSSLQKQVPGLLARNQAQGVSFEVAVREGKVVLRAVPLR